MGCTDRAPPLADITPDRLLLLTPGLPSALQPTPRDPSPGTSPTFGQPQLLQLAGQRVAVYAVFGRAGEDEAEHGNSGLHVPRLWREEEKSLGLCMAAGLFPAGRQL